jgi:hypothetical protein
MERWLMEERMDSSFDPQLAALLGVIAFSLAGVLLAIVQLVRSGRSVNFPGLETRRRVPSRSRQGDHVAIR